MPVPCCSEVAQKAIFMDRGAYSNMTPFLHISPTACAGWTLPVLQAYSVRDHKWTFGGERTWIPAELFHPGTISNHTTTTKSQTMRPLETHPSSLPGAPGNTSSIPRPAYSVFPTTHVKQAGERLVFYLTISNRTISGSFTDWLCFAKETWGFLWGFFFLNLICGENKKNY